MNVSSLNQTIRYTDFFDSCLTINDLHLWLISPKKCSLAQVKKLISKYPNLQKKLIKKHDVRKNKFAVKKIKKIQNLLFILKYIPTIKLISLTGSLSVNNPKKQDDVDLMIITIPNTLWLTRPIVVLVTKLFFKIKQTDSICLNLWLDTNALVVPKFKQNLYTAHEVLQIKPLFDRGGVYQQFILSNSWAKKYLANAYAAISIQDGSGECLPRGCVAPAANLGGGSVRFYAFLRGLLRGGTRSFNLLAFKLQYFYMKNKITHEYITLHSAYFHPRNLYPQIKKHIITPLRCD